MEKVNHKLQQLLTAPGNGVFTVHTAKEKKQDLWQKLYQTVDQAEVENKWKASLALILKNNDPILLGICSDSGGGIQRGANWGPLFIRNYFYKTEKNFSDIGDIRVIPHLLHDKYLNSATIENCRLALFQDQKIDLPVSPLSITEKVCNLIYESNPKRPIIGLGGDHSVSYPLVKSWLEKNKKKNIKSAIIHFDAHTDLLDQRLGIDICFGSWARHMLPLLDSPDHLIQIGIRSSGKDRQHWESNLGVKQYWAQEVIQNGSYEIAQKIIADLTDKKIEEIYISFDIDALDSEYASATGTPENKGPAPHHLISIIDLLAAKFKITGADLVEVAPMVNAENKINIQDNTLIVANEILKNLYHHAKN